MKVRLLLSKTFHRQYARNLKYEHAKKNTSNSEVLWYVKVTNLNFFFNAALT